MDWKWEITKWALSILYTAFIVWLGYKWGMDEGLTDFGSTT